MRKILFILLLLPFVSQGQSTLPFSTIGVQNDDTAYTPNTLRLPKYQTSDTNKVFGIDARGVLVLRTKGVAATPTLDQVLVSGNSAPTRTAIIRQLNLNNGNGSGVQVSQIKNTNITADNTQQLPDIDGTLMNDNSIFSSDGSVTIDIATDPGFMDITVPVGNFILNQNASAQSSANFWIDGTGVASEFTAKSATAPFLKTYNTNSSTTNSTGSVYEINGQNPANLFLVSKHATNVIPPLDGGRGTTLTLISPGNFNYIAQGATFNGDHNFYTNFSGAAIDSVAKFTKAGKVYVYSPQEYTPNKDTVLYQDPFTGQIKRTRINRGDSTVIDNAGTLTVSTLVSTYVFTGTTSTWTMPPAANRGSRIVIINRGSGTITVNSNAGGNDLVDIYAGSLTTVNTVNITTTTKVEFFNDGVYWLMTP